MIGNIVLWACVAVCLGEAAEDELDAAPRVERQPQMQPTWQDVQYLHQYITTVQQYTSQCQREWQYYQCVATYGQFYCNAGWSWLALLGGGGDKKRDAPDDARIQTKSRRGWEWEGDDDDFEWDDKKRDASSDENASPKTRRELGGIWGALDDARIQTKSRRGWPWEGDYDEFEWDDKKRDALEAARTRRGWGASVQQQYQWLRQMAEVELQKLYYCQQQLSQYFPTTPTQSPTTAAHTTFAPTTAAPMTAAPVTAAATTAAAITFAATTAATVTTSATTAAP